MTETEIIVYQDSRGNVPLLRWMVNLPKRDRAKCIEKIERLASYGHMLRRPDCDYLSDGIYELRARAGNVNYRIFYAFAGKRIVCFPMAVQKNRI